MDLGKEPSGHVEGPVHVRQAVTCKGISSALVSVTMAGDVMPVYSDAELPPPPPPRPKRKNNTKTNITADRARFFMTESLIWSTVFAADSRLFSPPLPIVTGKPDSGL
jgi:hypothetical protein